MLRALSLKASGTPGPATATGAFIAGDVRYYEHLRWAIGRRMNEIAENGRCPAYEQRRAENGGDEGSAAPPSGSRRAKPGDILLHRW